MEGIGCSWSEPPLSPRKGSQMAHGVTPFEKVAQGAGVGGSVGQVARGLDPLL